MIFIVALWELLGRLLMYLFTCLGAWAPQLCEMLNINIPIVPMKHAYVIFEKMDEVKKLPNIRDHDGGIYFLIKGDV